MILSYEISRKGLNEMKKHQKKELLKIIVSAILFVAAIITDKAALNESTHFLIRLALYMPAYLVAGFEVLKNAACNIIHGSVFDENFLMAIAGIGAFFVGECPEAVIIMLFYDVGELFQDVAVENSRSSVKELLTLAPETANVIRDGAIETVNARNVKQGELIVVKAGEKIPLDGTVTQGNTALDMSALTGESLPVNVCEGKSVLSASINMQNAITVKVEKEYKDSTATLIQQTVENAVAQKPKVDKFITKFARYYTPAVVIIAVFISLIVPLFSGNNFSEWIYRGLMLLVISCPCALVISVPLGFFISIGAAAKNGVLIKGCSTVEILKNASIAVFDKTGTITKGNFKVSEIYSENTTEEELKRIAVSIEKFSNHPIAKAICTEFCGSKAYDDLSDAEEIAGKGLAAVLNGEKILAGNKSLLESYGIDVTAPSAPGTAVHIARGDVYCGYILISDEIKNGAADAISDLKSLGIKKTVMLTGDNAATAKAIALKTGIDQAEAQLLPNQKAELVSELMNQKGKNEKLIFTGDGINDAPSITSADIGVAMGKSGTDIAIEVADVVIMDDKIQKLPYLIRLSKTTMRIITENIVVSLLIKAVIFALSIAGKSNMWFAIFADVGALILAILNTLRIRGADKIR